MVSVDTETDLFALLADETRAAILDELAARLREHPGDPTCSFSELRERVGQRDAGNFDYHLKKLRDRFVERTDDGYRLTAAGTRIAAVLVSVRPGDPFDRPLDADCPFCDAALRLRHEHGVVDVVCEAGHEITLLVPHHVTADRSAEEAVEAVATVAGQQAELIVGGTCPLCYGRLDLGLDRPVSDADAFEYALIGACDGCGMAVGIMPAVTAVDELPVRTFYADHGVDLRSRPLWDHPLMDADAHAFDSDPPRAVFTDRRGDETLRVVVDAEGDVESVEVS